MDIGKTAMNGKLNQHGYGMIMMARQVWKYRHNKHDAVCSILELMLNA